MKVYIETLGCKVNFADSASISSYLAANGYTVITEPSEADLYIINSCSVTHRAERECRQLARRFHSYNPSAGVIITGCSVLSGTFRKRIGEIHFVNLVNIKDIPQILGLHLSSDIRPYYNRSRPFIKIQEGCDRFCSYCIVPYLRGKPRSVDINSILASVKTAAENGFMEIVLVGTHIMLYKDPVTGKDIYGLLGDIENIEGKFRVRLSSVEPYGLNEENIRRLSEYKRLCAHFHIPLQSGSDKVLNEMGRDYYVSDFRNVTESIKERFPEAAIGTDIITGFPSETEADFEKTVDFISSVPVDYLHVFRFSPREGTIAASMKQLASQSEIKRRSEILLKISFDKRRDMLKKYIGREMDILITENSEKVSGLTHNYIRVILNKGNYAKGQLCRVNLKSINENNTITGEPI